MILDRDPMDETQHPEDGICARPWCKDAALPAGDFCANCEGDIEIMEQEALREAAVDKLVQEVKERERWVQSMAELYGDTE